LPIGSTPERPEYSEVPSGEDVSFYVAFLRSEALYVPGLCPLRWKGITMRKTLLALAAAASLAVSAVSPACAFPRYYSGPGGYPYYSGYVDAPVGDPIAPCHWKTQRFWDGFAWRVRRVRVCG
jgi:hypothetical protein